MSMLPNGSGHPIPAPQSIPTSRPPLPGNRPANAPDPTSSSIHSPKSRYQVIVCDTCPLEADEIRRVFRHADQLGDFYYLPGAQSVKHLAVQQDYFGDLRPSMWAQSPIEVFLSRSRTHFSGTWLICPSAQLLEDVMSLGEDILKSLHLTTVKSGPQEQFPAAIIQVQSELGIFPDRRQQLVAYFAEHYISPPENIRSHLPGISAFPETIPTRTELDWLLSRNYRLQGISAEQEQFARETWATRSEHANWVCGGGFSANLITIETPYADCTPFYDLIYRDHCDGRFRAVKNGIPLTLITTPEAHYLINKLGCDYLFDELHKDVEARGLTLPRVRSMRLCYGAASAIGFTPPGGLHHYARIYRPMIYETYSRDLDPAVIVESSIFS